MQINQQSFDCMTFLSYGPVKSPKIAIYTAHADMLLYKEYYKDIKTNLPHTSASRSLEENWKSALQVER